MVSERPLLSASCSRTCAETLLPPQMEQLEQKLARELPDTAKVVACRFPFPTWVPERTAGEGADTVWLYDVKQSRRMEHEAPQ